VLVGWRDATVAIDLVMRPESDAMLRAIPLLKERLRVNVEYDFSAQALAKLERGHGRDIADVHAMLDRGLVTRAVLRRLYETIEPSLYRYPAIDPSSLRRAVDEIAPP
jgi:hypothetical protein